MSLPTCNDTVRRLNPHLFGPPIATHGQVCAPMGDHGKPRLRQRTGPKLNKTESAFFENLKATMGAAKHYAQSITFLIGNGVRFTPDFVSIFEFPKMIIAWETKGFMRDDAAVKIKVAAATYPSIVFKLVTRKKGGGWDVQEVLP